MSLFLIESRRNTTEREFEGLRYTARVWAVQEQGSQSFMKTFTCNVLHSFHSKHFIVSHLPCLVAYNFHCVLRLDTIPTCIDV